MRNDDLISRDALIMAIRGAHIISGTSMAIMLDIVKKAPTVGGWISVKERMPEEHKLVLATDETFYVHVNWIVEGKWIRPFHNRITYWMTIPNLPKEVDDDET